MAATPQPLVWKFYRQVTEGANVRTGGVVHYYDEESQSIYLNGGMITRTGEVPEGHWATSELSSPLTINTQPYSNLEQDHPSNGILYFSAADGGTLSFLRYNYAMDISDFMESWSWATQNDNAISQFTGAVQNLGPDIFGVDSTLFQPGARIILAVRMGNSQPFSLGTAFLDEFDYDVKGETADLSGRNRIGYFLKDQTFDDETTWNGTPTSVISAILAYAGLKKYVVQSHSFVGVLTVEPTEALLDGINQIAEYHSTVDRMWKTIELPNGMVCSGYEDWLAAYLPNSYYSFDEGKDVFSRSTSKLSDSSYVKVRCTGKYKDYEDNDVDLVPVTVPVNNFPYWALGAHRTKHLQAPDGFSQAELQAWANAQALKYQYVGIGEDFTSPFRPQLVVGDVAEIVTDGVGLSLGLITEITQSFSKSDGFKTDFSVDSGGVATDGPNYVIYSRAAEVSGFNRRQRVVDLVRYISKNK